MSDVDVAIAGAGAAGLFAALAAADEGRTVMVLERDRRFADNANTGRSTGLITAGGTSAQAHLGVHDSAERYIADLTRKNRGQSDPELVRAVATTAPIVVDVASDRWGAPLAYIPDLPFPGHTINRAHGPEARKGRYLVEALLAEVRKRSNIDLVSGMAVSGLLQGDHGDVVGVLAAPEGSPPEALTSGRVILAVNGFGANTDWVLRYIPEIASAVYFGGPGSDGAGIAWGLEVGAGVATMDAYQGHCSISPDAGTLLPFILIGTGGAMFNSEGNRFGDESVGYSEFAVLVSQQSGNLAWEVFDGQSYRAAMIYEDFQESLAAGVVRECSGLAQLASRTGLPLASLEREFTEMERSHDDAKEDRFGRRHHRRLQPPLYAVRVSGALFHTQGGLRVDARARVLRPNGAVVPGLYAAGGTAAGVSGHGAAGYMAGNGLTAAAVLGYLAGADEGGPSGAPR